MTVALRRFLDFAAPLPPENEKHQLKKQCVRNTITEIALITLCTDFSCYFSVSNELRWAFIKQGIRVVGFNALARVVATGYRYAALIERDLFFRTVSFVLDWVAPYYFAREFHQLHRLGHEGGHIISAYFLYGKQKIQLTAYTMWAWNALITRHGLSKIGNCLGEFRVKMVFLAAGPLATVVTNQIALIAALCLKKAYPELSKYILLQPLSSLYAEIKYAWDVFDTANVRPENDFLQLWKEGGIHPYFAIGTMIALPVISTLGFLGLRYR